MLRRKTALSIDTQLQAVLAALKRSTAARHALPRDTPEYRVALDNEERLAREVWRIIEEGTTAPG